MKNIKIFDTTLRDGEQAPNCTMKPKEKFEFARTLAKLNVDIIEAGFPISSKGDFEAVSVIANEIKGRTVCALARALEKDIDSAYAALKGADSPRIHIFIATSPVHMKYKLRMSEEQVLERVIASVKYAKKFVSDVQLSAEDATRSDMAFLTKVFNAAVKSGATVINIADTVGYSEPNETAKLFDHITSTVDLTNVDLGIHCHNDLGMAVANSLTAIQHGATQIEGTINGIGERSGNAALEEIIMAIYAKPQTYDASTNINLEYIYKTSNRLNNLLGFQVAANKPIVGGNAFRHESGIHQHGIMEMPLTYQIIEPEVIGVPKQQMDLGKHSGMHAFKQFVEEIGYNCTEEELKKHFSDFKALCDKKKTVTRLDIEALITNNRAIASGEAYRLKNYLIATQKDGAFATVTLLLGDEEIAFQEKGNGAIDSSFGAINKIVKQDLVLLDYSLRAITGGEDALGEAVVKVSDGKNTVTGRGLSVDIIEASLKAYIDSANKLKQL